MFGKFFSFPPSPTLWNCGLALGAFRRISLQQCRILVFSFYIIFKKECFKCHTSYYFFFHSARWFPLLLPFACGCSQNMCVSSDVIVTKDNSLRRQEINAKKGWWWLPEQMKLVKKIKSQAEKGWERQKGPSRLGAAAREETRTSNMYSFHIHTQKSLAIFLFHLACPLHLAWFVQ